jgi:hypothetical protein
MSDPPDSGCATINTVIKIQIEWLVTSPGACPI